MEIWGTENSQNPKKQHTDENLCATVASVIMETTEQNIHQSVPLLTAEDVHVVDQKEMKKALRIPCCLNHRSLLPLR